MALPVIVGATALKGVRLARRGLPPALASAFAAGVGAAFVSTLASVRIIRAVERDRSLRALSPPTARRSRAWCSGALGRIARDERRLCRRRRRHGPGRRARSTRSSASCARSSSTGPAPRCCASGHYASVLRVAPNLGIAVSTDGVGSKLVVAEQADRLETVGIDCIAMNVNDLVCVGAEPIAMLDYLAVEQADPRGAGAHRAGAEGRRAGRGHRDPRRRAGGAARAHPRPSRRPTASTCAAPRSAPSRSTRSSPAPRPQPGDAIIGLPSSGLHSNGYTLARRALLRGRRARPRRPPGAARRPLGGRRAARADRHLRARRARPAALGHRGPRPGPHHRRRPAQPAAPGRRPAGLRHRGAAAGARPSSRSWPSSATSPTSEMWDVFNMGCGFVARRPRGRRADEAVALLAAPPPRHRAHRHGDRRGRAAVGAGAVGLLRARACGAARRLLPHRGKEVDAGAPRAVRP